MEPYEMREQLRQVANGGEIEIVFLPGSGPTQLLSDLAYQVVMWLTKLHAQRQLYMNEGSRTILYCIVMSQCFDRDENRAYHLVIPSGFDVTLFDPAIPALESITVLPPGTIQVAEPMVPKRKTPVTWLQMFTYILLAAGIIALVQAAIEYFRP
jgi:hypothetical protein